MDEPAISKTNDINLKAEAIFWKTFLISFFLIFLGAADPFLNALIHSAAHHDSHWIMRGIADFFGPIDIVQRLRGSGILQFALLCAFISVIPATVMSAFASGDDQGDEIDVNADQTR